MPRDGVADDVADALDPLTALPAWVMGEKRLSSMLPYVSLVTDRTIRTRGNELMQCIRLEGVNSTTSEDAHLDRIGGLLAGIVAQVGTGFSFYLHKVSKAVDVTLPPISGAGFAAAVDQRWQAHLGRSGLRDKTLTLTVLKRPEAGGRLPFSLGASRARHTADTTRRLRKLDEVVGFLLSSFDELKPRLLAARTGELLGFLGSLNTGEEHPLYPRSRLGVIAEDVANTRVTFRGTTIALSDGAVGDKLGTIFAVKNYPAKTDSLMLDEMNLPIDMVVTHSFVPINANMMAGRIKRQLRLMQAANDGAVTLAAAVTLLAAPLAAQTSPQVTNDLTVTMSPQQYRICNDRPTRPTWMDEVHPRESYKALTLMDLYELRAWEQIVETGSCGCDVRFPEWEDASSEFDEIYLMASAAEHTAAQRDIRQQRNDLRHAVQDLCEAQGNW